MPEPLSPCVPTSAVRGLVLLVSMGIYGLATALFGISTSLMFSYVLYALTGASDTVSTVIRNTIRQLLTPDNLRGRMTSVNMIFFMGGPPANRAKLEAGYVWRPSACRSRFQQGCGHCAADRVDCLQISTVKEL
ncbi:MAG: hypothetical protein U0694_02650 [Anaerolineae bacterium]